jgi:hypothetical protein
MNEVMLKLLTHYNVIVVLCIFITGGFCFLLGALWNEWKMKTKLCPTCKGDGRIKRKKK